MTLIEMMIVGAIVAILAAIAYPSYQDQIRRSRRAAAQSWLMDVAARQQQQFVDVRAYSTTYAATGLTTPAEVASHYTIGITPPAAGAPPGFSVTATPIAAQTEDRCGVLAINQAGTKTAGGVANPECW